MENLPIELIDMITAEFGPRDLGAMRLACHSFNDIVLLDHFLSYFESRNVLLRPKFLLNMETLTRENDLVCRLRHLTITGVLKGVQQRVENPRTPEDELLRIQTLLGLSRTPQATDGKKLFEKERQEQEKVSQKEAQECTHLLTRILENIKQRSPSGAFSTLRLRFAMQNTDSSIAPIRDTDGIRAARIWQETRRTFRIVMDALATVQIPVENELDLFRFDDKKIPPTEFLPGDDPMREKVYGFSCDELIRRITPLASASTFTSVSATTPALDGPFPWTSVFGTIKTLRMSISMPPGIWDTYEFRNERRYDMGMSPEAIRDEDSRQTRNSILQRQNWTKLLLSTLLTIQCLSPQLETVDVHDIRLARRWSTPKAPETAPEEDASPQKDTTLYLKECRFSGLNLLAPDLVYFLQRTQPESLTVAATALRNQSGGGGCGTLFDFLTEAETRTSSYVLDDLYSQSMVHFEIPGEPKFPYQPDSTEWHCTPSTLSRQGDEVKRPISYHRAVRPMGSVQTAMWMNYYQELYTID